MNNELFDLTEFEEYIQEIVESVENAEDYKALQKLSAKLNIPIYKLLEISICLENQKKQKLENKSRNLKK